MFCSAATALLPVTSAALSFVGAWRAHYKNPNLHAMSSPVQPPMEAVQPTSRFLIVERGGTARDIGPRENFVDIGADAAGNLMVPSICLYRLWLLRTDYSLVDD